MTKSDSMAKPHTQMRVKEESSRRSREKRKESVRANETPALTLIVSHKEITIHQLFAQIRFDGRSMKIYEKCNSSE